MTITPAYGRPAAAAPWPTMAAMNANPARPRVYLAGPDVFLPDSRDVFERLRAACARLGLEGVEPSDGGLAESGPQGATDDELAQRIYEGNMRLIHACDGVIANLCAFRGLEPDSGTVFEVGYAVALGKPVVGYGVAPGSYADRVGAALPCIRSADGHLRETGSGAMVEGLGQRLNLMLTRSTPLADSAEAALGRLAQQLKSRPTSR
ncbi:Nucleoside 2-deoxyribosyltransferase [Xylophilus ampelinus]|nr:Nucleoside 2-deoxyribosyltransferase [Xylophilus ampelinus]